jgi:riboflavin synthase
MYTGIVAGVGTVIAIEKRVGLYTFTIELPQGSEHGLAIGASVAIDGVCLTVTSFSDHRVTFDAMQQTLAVTTLGALEIGSFVNIERSARLGDEIGGHPLSGHVDFVAPIVKVQQPEHNHAITFEFSEKFRPYIFLKGYIGVHGASLTVAEVDLEAHTFTVWLIPETLRLTSFGKKVIGDVVNIEIDRTTQVVVDTVKSYLSQSMSEIK